MIEAVNSVLANASFLRNEANRNGAQQIQESLESAASQASEAVTQFPRAPFISPVVSMDNQFDRAVLLLRNSEDGEVTDQIPSESALRADRRSRQGDSQQLAPNTSDVARLQQSENTASFVQTVSTLQSSENSSASASSFEALATQALQASQGSSQLGGSVNLNA